MLPNKPEYYKRLGKVDTSNLIDFLNYLKFSINEKYNRDAYFLNCDSCFIVEHGKVLDENLLKMFMQCSKDLIDCLHLSYGSGTSNNIQFSLLKPDGLIKEHSDIGEGFEQSHRIHLPLVTNGKVEFFIGKRKYNFEEGIAVEINNQKNHSVANRSSKDRIHLIIDYRPKYIATLRR